MLSKLIHVLDGAMGTMIQKRELEEEDFRGTEFGGWTRRTLFRAAMRESSEGHQIRQHREQ